MRRSLLPSSSRPGRAKAALGIALALLMSSAPSLSISRAWASDLAVVVHPQLSLENISRERLRRIFMGDQQFWPGGKPVTLLVQHADTPERGQLLRSVFRMSEAQFKQYWIAKVFRAEIAAGPKTVLSNDMAAQLITAIPGAIAVMPADQVPEQLKTLRIDGQLPGQPGYGLD